MASHNTPFSLSLLLLLLVLTTAPLETYARNTQFFSKVSRTTPQASSDPKKSETQALSPSASTPVFTKATDERGYGLYEYPPTTTNPTKSKPADRDPGKLAESDDQGHESFFQGEGSETGGKQGSVYGKTGEKQGRVYGNRAEKQGMGDTRFLENRKYFYDIEAEKMSNNNNNNNGYSDSYKYRNEEEEEEEGGDEFGSEVYGTGEEQGNNRVYGKQGMSDTRFLENGKYFYDIEAEKKNNVAFYDRNNRYEGEGNNGEELVYRKERYVPEEAKYGVKGGELRSYSPNKFPRYEFDSMEEYEKYEEGRSHQNEYAP